MNTAKAITKYIKISARKARLAADLIRGKSVAEATSQLTFCQLKAGPLLQRTLDSAVANAEMQLDVSRDKLTVDEVRVDEGPTVKRARPKCKGSRVPILKRTSHFTIVVSADLAEKETN